MDIENKPDRLWKYARELKALDSAERSNVPRTVDDM